MAELIKKENSDSGTPTDEVLIKKESSDSGRPKDDSAVLFNKEYFEYAKKQIKKDVKKAKAEILQELESQKEDIILKIKEQEQSKINIIEALALFVALFTFVSVNITIFSKIEYLAAGIWFMILMAIAQTLILTIFLIFLNKSHHNLKSWIAPGILILLLIFLQLWSLGDEKLNPRINYIKSEESIEKVSRKGSDSSSIQQNALANQNNTIINDTNQKNNSTQASDGDKSQEFVGETDYSET